MSRWMSGLIACLCCAAAAAGLASRARASAPGSAPGVRSVSVPAAGPAGRHVASEPRRGARNRGELHLGGGGRRGARRRDHPVLVRAQARHHQDEDDRQGHEHEPAGRPRWGRAGDAERWRAPPHPLHGHLRSGAGVDDVALPGSSLSEARRPEPDLHATATRAASSFDGGGGGAIFDRGGRLAHRQLRRSPATAASVMEPDIGGGAVRALSQYHALPVYVVNSRFTANACSNGGALSSIGVSWTVLNSRFLANRAVGTGANPAQAGHSGRRQRRRDLQRRGPDDPLDRRAAGSMATTPTRAAGRSSSSATTAPARWRSPQHPRAQPQRPIPHRRPAGNLLPRGPAPHDHAIRPALSAAWRRASSRPRGGRH